MNSMESFSLTTGLLRDVFRYAKPLGHNQQPGKLNLGFGFIYYGIVRAIRPKHTLVIGSGYGFSVVCLALGIKDNGEGSLTFVDPSYSLLKNGPLMTVGGVNKWGNQTKVYDHFRQFGVEDFVKHYKLRNDQFFPLYESDKLPGIDIAFIDGSHSYIDVKYDFINIVKHSHKNSYIFLHDTNLYIREMIRHSGVKRWLKVIRQYPDYFEVLDFPFDCGLAIVRVLQDKIWEPT
ncbi:MAG: hypothetical protein A2052_01490 [Deltaproteobacteria bacterium GWA2_54_12]|nr:MAG: hypothetical protein A2052_01490 [Deltaproteobacteria bacterium GWA2_54_12]